MKTANVADLRNNFSQISNWILAGEEVLIKRRGKVFARLSPPHHSAVKVATTTLDRYSRLKKIYSQPVKGDLQSIISEQRD
jgi:antitoxin (DNA-binding transcriptional repressor) of toxin-antitoxin stability system